MNEGLNQRKKERLNIALYLRLLRHKDVGDGTELFKVFLQVLSGDSGRDVTDVDPATKK